jgi:putative acetyltransferase
MAIIRPAHFPNDIDAIVEIWREFVTSPSVSLEHQNNEADFVSLPGKYRPSAGLIMLAEIDNHIVGTVSYRRIDAAICEMKRLYVRPEARGIDLGRTLTVALIDAARLAGYTEMRLDVLSEFIAARALYAQLGFVPAEPVSFNPLPGTAFLGLRL